MPKENLDHATGKKTQLPQRAGQSGLVYWFSCFQTAVQQKPIDKEMRGVSMAFIEQGKSKEEEGKGRVKTGHHFSFRSERERK